MNAIHQLSEVLSRLGLHPTIIPDAPNGVALSTQATLFPLLARIEDDRLRLICRLREGVVRNRLSLWHLSHLNASPMPYGQWTIGQESALDVSALVPTEAGVLAQLERITVELLYAAEAYMRQAHTDFAELPFDESKVAPCLLNLIRSDLTVSAELFTPSVATPSALMGQLIRSLPEAMARPLAETSTVEELHAELGGRIIGLSASDLPFVRQRGGRATWSLVIRTEVGSLDAPDAPLYALLNRQNYHSFGATAALRQSGRRASVIVHTELPAAATSTDEVIVAMNRVAAMGDELAKQLPASYRLRTPVVMHSTAALQPAFAS
jgi:hypothetical protein